MRLVAPILLLSWWCSMGFGVSAESDAVSEQPRKSDAGDTVTESMNSFRGMFSRIFSLKGDFEQDVQCGDANPSSSFSGTFELKRKGRYRFNYKKPKGKTIVSDGERTFVYDRTAHFVSAGSADSLLSLLGGLLIGESIDAFEMVPLVAQDAGALRVLRFVPRSPDPFVRQVLLTVSNKLPHIRRIVVVDGGGCIIRTTLSNVQINTGIKDRRFRFEPPKNAEVVSP